MKPKVIVIGGPTASGKTSASIELAKKINGEIISADSMQIYKEMNIGTAKPSIDEMDGIKHYLIDVVSPNENFNVTRYVALAKEAIEEILSKGKTPIIVGGTGLYISTLINGIEFSEVEEDPAYRKEMLEFAEKNGIDALHEKLKEIDEEAAKIIDANNVRRVIRALEICKVTGKTKTQVDLESKKEVKYDYMLYIIDTPREELYDRINRRVDNMVSDGLLLEVENLIKKYDVSKTAMQGLGYKEVVMFFNKELSYDEMIEKIKLETRHYAKRQLTWFRREKNATWCPLKDIVSKIILDLNEDKD